MLWDIIRDWFVQYVFGGFASNGEGYFPSTGVGHISSVSNVNLTTTATTGDGFDMTSILIKVGQDGYAPDLRQDVYLSTADWLSTTATIITLIAGCVLLFFMLKWLFKLFAGMISGVGR